MRLQLPGGHAIRECLHSKMSAIHRLRMQQIAVCAATAFHHLTGALKISNEKGLLARIGEVVEATKGKAQEVGASLAKSAEGVAADARRSVQDVAAAVIAYVKWRGEPT
jgi:hypothetical protein